MKTTKKSFRAVLLYIAFIAGGCSAASQNPGRVEKMRTVIEQKNFTFKPEAILPLASTGGRLDLATGRYVVTLNNGTLTSDLPFVGESISPTIGRDEENIRFTTTDFTYNVKNIKKNHWEITLRPQNQQQVSDMVFSVFDNGTATLRVNSNTRQAVSFSGYLVQHN